MRLLVALLLVSTALGAGCFSPAASAPADALPEVAPGLSCPAPCKSLVAPAAYGTREPVVVADPRDPSHLLAASMVLDVMAEAAGTFRLDLHESRDAGATWTTARYPLPTMEDGVPATQTYDPALAFLPDGTAVLGGVAIEGAYFLLGMAQGGARVFSARSQEGGPAFADARTVERGEGVEARSLVAGAAALRAPDKPSLAAGPDGALLMAYGVRSQATPADAGRAALALSVSRDGAGSWAPVAPPPTEGDAFPGAVVVARDAWYVAFVTFDPARLSERDFACWLAVSADEGGSWDTRPLGACDWLPALAERDGALSVVVSAPAAAGSQPTLLRSRDRGATWDAPLALDTPEAEGETIPTALALPDGALVATYFHALPDGGTSFRAVAVRGGAVSAPVVLDERLSRAPTRYGEYFGLAPVPGGAVATWVADEGDKLAVAAARLAVG